MMIAWFLTRKLYSSSHNKRETKTELLYSDKHSKQWVNVPYSSTEKDPIMGFVIPYHITMRTKWLNKISEQNNSLVIQLNMIFPEIRLFYFWASTYIKSQQSECCNDQNNGLLWHPLWSVNHPDQGVGPVANFLQPHPLTGPATDQLTPPWLACSPSSQLHPPIMLPPHTHSDQGQGWLDNHPWPLAQVAGSRSATPLNPFWGAASRPPAHSSTPQPLPPWSSCDLSSQPA